MGRFADPSRTATLALPGGCQCPGSPHAADEWEYRTELGDSEIKSCGVRALIGGVDADGEPRIDMIALQDNLLEVASVRWNLVDQRGMPVPLRRASFALLDETTRDAMLKALDAATTPAGAPPPNSSAALSASGSPESGSSIPTAS